MEHHAVARALEKIHRTSDRRWLRTLVEAIPDAAIIADNRGEIVVANENAERLFGYEPHALPGTHVDSLLPERYRLRHAAHRHAWAARPRSRPMGQGLELIGRRKDGTEFSAEIGLTPLETTGEPLVLAVCRGLTGERARIAALRVSQQILEFVIEQMPVTLWSTNHELQVTSILGSASWQESTDEDGRGVESLARRFEPAEAVIAAHRSALRGHADRVNVTWNDRILEISTQPLRNWDGILIGSLGMAVDVTERERSQRLLHSAKQAFETILEASPAAIVTTDLEGRITTWNAAAERIFGWSAAEVVGRTPPFIPADEEAAVRQAREQALRGVPELSMEMRRLRKDGALVDVVASCAPLPGTEGTVEGVVTILVDVTAHRRAQRIVAEQEAQLREARRMEVVGKMARDRPAG